MNNAQYYDIIASRYRHRESLRYHRFLNDVTADILRRNLPEGRLLDAGCGCGHLAKRMADKTRQIIGLDLSMQMLKNSPIPAVRAAIETIPLKTGSVDAAWSMRVFPHLRSPALALKELARVIRPGGKLALDIYNPISLRALTDTLKNMWNQCLVLSSGRKSSALPEPGSVHTQFETIRRFRQYLPPEFQIEKYYGIRIITPCGIFMEIPGAGPALEWLERCCMRSDLRIFGGFLLMILIRK
jgi:ubiquinone/menaquinone biosynthesis C-methylase UbiE